LQQIKLAKNSAGEGLTPDVWVIHLDSYALTGNAATLDPQARGIYFFQKSQKEGTHGLTGSTGTNVNLTDPLERFATSPDNPARLGPHKGIAQFLASPPGVQFINDRYNAQADKLNEGEKARGSNSRAGRLSHGLAEVVYNLARHGSTHRSLAVPRFGPEIREIFFPDAREKVGPGDAPQ
jgi:hypothetical protein